MKKITIKTRTMKKFTIIQLIILALAFTGEIQCIYKAIRCNWAPIGKAEIVYTVAACTGVGCVVGWFNIEDK